ncbi:MAG: Asp23/Gls24 family envelope stress response protein [Chloroflexota bacterium]|nr:Asp23/Gls24 family envelope stress response protein [Chloroflexota bacterium]
MMEEKKLGRIIVAPEVLVTIAHLTTLSTPGVAHMGGKWMGEVTHLLGHKSGGDGVEITVEDQRVTADLYIVARDDVNLLDMSRQLQANVKRAIEEIVGLRVWAVNVYIQDVEISAEKGEQ